MSANCNACGQPIPELMSEEKEAHAFYVRLMKRRRLDRIEPLDWRSLTVDYRKELMDTCSVAREMFAPEAVETPKPEKRVPKVGNPVEARRGVDDPYRPAVITVTNARGGFWAHVDGEVGDWGPYVPVEEGSMWRWPQPAAQSAATEPAAAGGVKRYGICFDGIHRKDAQGYWVKHSDHVAAAEAADARHEAEVKKLRDSLTAKYADIAKLREQVRRLGGAVQEIEKSVEAAKGAMW